MRATQLIASELAHLNESLNALAYAALGQSPRVRRRRVGGQAVERVRR